MNSKGHNNIYELSRQIEDGNKDYEVEAKNIVNAYRQVEQLKVHKGKPAHKEQNSKHRPQSSYAMKVKQTLSQLKTSKNKQAEELSKHAVQPPVKIVKSNYNRKLYKAGLDRVVSVLALVEERTLKISIRRIKEYLNEQQQKEIAYLKKFRLFKLFRAWREVSLLSRMDKQRQNENQSRLVKLAEMAGQFRQFTLIKKSFSGWKNVHRRQIKKREYERELRRLEIEQEMMRKVEKDRSSKKKVEQNHQLQSKLRGFLDGLKDKIEHKDRLRTIKENTEESDPNIRINSDIDRYEEQDEIDSRENQQQEEQNIRQGQNLREIVIQPPQQQQLMPKKPMTNEELLKNRKQLEGKYKKRKETLQKLKKEKEEKRKQQEKQRAQLERQVEAQQQRIKQERYRQYLKNKREEQQWQRRQKQLDKIASEFNNQRLMKYYGWHQLKNIKEYKRKKAQVMYQSLLLIVYRVKATNFIQNLRIIADSILETQLERMQKRYQRKLLTKGLSVLWNNRSQELEQKADFGIRHEVNQIRIFFSEWKRVIPQLASENFDWERPRIKKAQEFHRIQLFIKTFSSLKENKRSQQQKRSISGLKAALHSKIKGMLQEEQDFNYEQFL